jgi:hypothetical protein
MDVEETCIGWKWLSAMLQEQLLREVPAEEAGAAAVDAAAKVLKGL